MTLRFVFALHNHQPVGNFDGVFEHAFRDSYGPFLDVLEQFPDIAVSLHTSGPLLEWLEQKKPDYIDRLRRLVQRGQVEIMGGGFYEPILPMIPSRDRVGQIASFKTHLEKLFQTKVRGMWIAERVWEQGLVKDIAAAGIEYTVLDDHHFRQAGVADDQLFGHFLSEDEGKLIRIFPISERMRYVTPFADPGETLKYFGEVAGRHGDCTIVCADDGEKFGVWPGTHAHCFPNGWLRRFFETLRSQRHWVRLCTFSQALDESPSWGKAYLPDCSYREMTEWALPTARAHSYFHVMRSLDHHAHGQEVKRFVRGGFWRNFKAKYPETEEMYARMLEVSQALQHAESEKGNESTGPATVLPIDQANAAARVANPALDAARRELYRAQCNCPWWHGSFGGLYLPHLRNAVYRHLIQAENHLLAAELQNEQWIDYHTADFNLDGKPEVKLSNRRLAAYFQPGRGGCLYELDLRDVGQNMLATLSRRPEVYHESIRNGHGNGCKQAGLEHLLIYDWYLRKSLVDHFFEPWNTLQDASAVRDKELGDFVLGNYDYQVYRQGPTVQVKLSRQGNAGGQRVRVTKEVTLKPGSDLLEINYSLSEMPAHAKLHFGVEFHFAGMAANADDRYFYDANRSRAGQLQSHQDLRDADKIGLVDEWLGLDASLTLSRRGGIWAFPIQSVSQSEGGYEMVHQSTAVMPHWHVEADSQGQWQVTMAMRLDVTRALKRLQPARAA